MKSIITSILTFCVFTIAQAQTADNVTYDLIYLEKGGVLKGNIESYDEVAGGISFKDNSGKMYSLSRDEYSYFKESVSLPVKLKDKKIRARKDNEMAYHVGFGLGGENVNQEFVADNYFLYGSEGSYLEGMLTMKAAVGKYFSRENYLGLTGEFSIASDADYLGVGLRGSRQYDGYKRNVAFYIPAELKFNVLNFTQNYSVADTTFFGGGSYSYPTNQDYRFKQTSVSLGLGQGVSFILENKKSVDLELMVSKHFNLGDAVVNFAATPQAIFDIVGVRLNLLYSL